MRIAAQAAGLIVIAALISQPLRAADDADKAQQLVNRAVQAMGGAEALEKSRNTIVEDEGTYYGMGQAVPYQGRYVYRHDNPGRFRMEILGVFVYVVDGDTGWSTMQGETTELEGQALNVAKRGMLVSYAMSLIPLQKPNKEFKLSLAQPETIDGEECRGIRIEHEKMPALTMHFSNKTGLIKKTKHTAKIPEENFREAVEEAIFHEYKEFDGWKAPTKMTMYRDGEKLVESTPTKVTFPTKLDDSEFQKPE